MSPDGVNPVAASGFDTRAGAYDRVRPPYPPDVAAVLDREIGVGPASLVVDLAAGTGKLTRALLGLTRVVAVEPLDGMLRELSASLPAVPAVRATAERLPFRDGAVDAVTVGQAFHWFDAVPTLAELARVLRPGGGVLLVWNERDDDVPWMARLTAVLRAAAEPPYALDVDYRALLDSSGAFGPSGEEVVRWAQPVTRTDVVDLVASRSYIASMSEADRAPVLADVAALVATQPERVELPYVTRIQWSRRLP